MKPEVWKSRERFTAAERTARVLLVFVYHVQIEKKHTAIKTCALDDFQNSRKCDFFFIILKMRKKSAVYQISNVWYFLSHLDQFVNACTPN